MATSVANAQALPEPVLVLVLGIMVIIPGISKIFLAFRVKGLAKA